MKAILYQFSPPLRELKWQELGVGEKVRRVDGARHVWLAGGGRIQGAADLDVLQAGRELGHQGSQLPHMPLEHLVLRLGQTRHQDVILQHEHLDVRPQRHPIRLTLYPPHLVHTPPGLLNSDCPAWIGSAMLFSEEVRIRGD